MTAKVNLQNIVPNTARYTFAVVGTMLETDVGKAVSHDITADNAVHLSAADEPVYGRVLVVEKRATGTVATIETLGGFTLPVAAGETFTRGQTPVGAGNGFVKAGPVADPRFLSVDLSKQTAQGFVVFMRT
jgi:hypothetical protein